MANYKASPFYEVDSGNIRVKFGFFGTYSTEKADEITMLDALVPTWIKRTDDVTHTEEPAAQPAKRGRGKASE
ncbi:hypothetical protein P4V86_15285 [Brevibacillus laterosporus]|uniref:hypothetical protein n=1 Tax=Brevibacillus laterosporus TaxID=1465 RepID=UPI0003650687|nr:hypothetical protein [Brevibacillus laterosporus]ATO51027.1 hypothetical protein BrL25_19155 [Brevibacillus laterosporus DSM 25]MED2004709.1 hypothetical protein [Brevibacillus laterosporus]